MKFVSISGPKNDLDRMVNQYLSHYEIQLANAQRSLTIVNFLFTVSTSDLLLGIFFYPQHVKTELVL